MVMDVTRRMTGDVAPEWRGPKLVILESTVYPGFTCEVFGEELRKSLTLDDDFFLAFSPERVDPGNPQYKIENTPKLVGGATVQSGHLACKFYESIVKEIHSVSSCEVAEMAKILENTFRMVNIGMANETALMCRALSLDVWEVIGAAATKPFGFMPFRPGPGTGGHCLPGSEWIYFRHKDRIMVGTVENLWHYAINEKVFSVEDTDVVQPKNIQVLGKSDSGFTWEPMRLMFRRPFSGTMAEIKTTCGYQISATVRHPMLVLEQTGLVEKEVGDLREKDRIPMFCCMPEEVHPVPIDMISHIPQSWIRKIRVRMRTRHWRDYKKQIYKTCNTEAKYDYVSDNYLPLSLFLQMEVCGTFDGAIREDLLLLTGRGASFNTVPAIFRVDGEFARLIGYYLSEGCITFDGSLRTRFTFGTHEENEYVSDLTGILDRIGLKWSQYIQQNSFHIKVSSDIFGLLIKHVLECGVDCYSKSIPSLFLGADKGIRRNLLCGLIQGDGSVESTEGLRSYVKHDRLYCHQNNSVLVSFFSSSERMVRQVVFLLQSLGIVPHVGFRKRQPGMKVCVHGSHDMKKCLLFLPGSKGDKIQRILDKKKRHPKKRTVDHYDGGYAVFVRNCETYPAEQFVYSLETDSHTFVCGFGMLVHNCIPVDPHYLSWKLKTLNYHSRFIELAGQVNAGMPAHVVSLVSEALNRRMRSVNGSRVLVLGASYKANVGDLRESPALDVMMLLCRDGAKVSFYDPYIESCRLPDCGHLKSIERCDLLNHAEKADCVVIVTDHADIPYREVCTRAPAIVDARNATQEFRDVLSHKIIVL